MKLQIYHLSDLHLQNDVDCKEKLEEIKTTLTNTIVSNSSGYDYCLLAVTGDITYSCEEDDYILACDFIIDIKNSIEKNYEKIYIFSVPGNHDCLISKGTSAVRHTLIDSIKSKKKNNKEITSDILDVQNNYFDTFDKVITQQKWSDNMIFIDELKIEGTSLHIIGLNSAWLSQINDVKDYYYPVELIPESSNNDFVITLMHHPFHWYETSCYHEIQPKLEQLSDIIMTGHDHIQSARGVSTNSTEYNILSGGIFYKKGSPSSTFSLYNIDLDLKVISCNEFSLKKGIYTKKEIFNKRKLQINSNKKDMLVFSKDYQEYLFDIDLSIKHSYKEDLNIEDIFIWPSLKTIDMKNNYSEKPVQNIKHHLKKEKKIIITGQESIGKTALAKMLINEFYKDNIFAIMPDFTYLKSFSKDLINKIINNQIDKQYGESNHDLYFSGTDISRRCIIIDDLHKININKKSQDDFLSMLEDMFDIVIILLNSSIEYFYNEATYIRMLEYNFCEINEFTNEQINKLVEKWIIAGRESDIDEHVFLRECDSAFKTIYSIMGTKNIMNRNPLNILLILNQWQINENFDTSKSAYAELCSSLINLNMQKLCNGDIDQMKKLDAILTNLSSYLYFNKNKANDFDDEDFNLVCDEYKKDKLVEQNNKEASNLLIIGKFIKMNENGSYKFKDRSVMYHYMAKYLGQNIDSQRDIIKRMVNHAYNEYNANILLFLSSMSNEKYILECLLEKMNEFLKLEDEFDFKNNEFKENIEQLTTLSLSNDVSTKDARRKSVKNLDAKRKGTEELENEEVGDEEIDDLLNINCIVRCIQIIGQLVKNGFHNMNGDAKVEIINDCYSLSLRTIRLIIKSIDIVSKEMQMKMYENIKDSESKSFDEYKLIFDNFTIHVKKKVTMSILMHVAHSTGSSELRLVYNELKKRNDTLGYRFIGIVTDLCILNKINENVLINFFNELKKKKLIFVCDMMRIIVSTYLYLNECDFGQRQRICASLDIDYEPKKLLDKSK